MPKWNVTYCRKEYKFIKQANISQDYFTAKMRVSEYLTQLPPKSVLEDRLKLYSRLLDEEEGRP